MLFVIHVMDSENATRLLRWLDRCEEGRAVVVINCMPELMKRTRLGKLDLERLSGIGSRKGAKAQSKSGTQKDAHEAEATGLLRSVGSWIGRQARGNGSENGEAKGHGRAQYLKFANRLPSLLRFVPGAGALRDVKNYLMMFCYFLQPTPANIRSMLLYALKHYVDDEKAKQIKIPPPESMPAVAIYHPDASGLFESFADYQKWYLGQRQKEKVKSKKGRQDPRSEIHDRLVADASTDRK